MVRRHVKLAGASRGGWGVTALALGGIFKLVRGFRARKRRLGLGRALLQAAERLHLDKTLSRRSVRLLKIVLDPLEYCRRRRIAPMTIAAGDLKVWDGLDYLALPPDSLEGIDELKAHCQGLLERRLEELEGNFNLPTTMIIDLTQDDDGLFLSDPDAFAPIVRFATQPRLIGIIAGYIREIPVISNVSLAYTPVNEMTTSSQRFHRDINQERQLHLIVALSDIDEDAGPFTFVPGAKSRIVRRRIGHIEGRVDDETLFQHVSKTELVRCTGKAGDAYLVNPYACFHMGARSRGKPRYHLIINYTSLFEWNEGGSALYRARNREALDNGSELCRDLLNL